MELTQFAPAEELVDSIVMACILFWVWNIEYIFMMICICVLVLYTTLHIVLTMCVIHMCLKI